MKSREARSSEVSADSSSTSNSPTIHTESGAIPDTAVFMGSNAESRALLSMSALPCYRQVTLKFRFRVMKHSDWMERTNRRTQGKTSHDADGTTALRSALGVFGVNDDLPTISGRCSIP